MNAGLIVLAPAEPHVVANVIPHVLANVRMVVLETVVLAAQQLVGPYAQTHALEHVKAIAVQTAIIVVKQYAGAPVGLIVLRHAERLAPVIVEQHVRQDVKIRAKMAVKPTVMPNAVLAAQMTAAHHAPLPVETAALMTVLLHALQLVNKTVRLVVRNHVQVVAMIHALSNVHLVQVIVLLDALAHVPDALAIALELTQQILQPSLKTSYEIHGAKMMPIKKHTIKTENKLKGSVLSEPLFFCLDKKYLICYNIIVNKRSGIYYSRIKKLY